MLIIAICDDLKLDRKHIGTLIQDYSTILSYIPHRGLSLFTQNLMRLKLK